MDSEPLWHKEDNGNYGLLFPNKHALSLEEIRKIFIQFGTVCCINKAGDERGFRFVQLEHEHEANRAVIGLQNHPTVKLIPYRPKQKKTNIVSKCDGESDQLQSPPSNGNYQRNLFKRHSTDECTEALYIANTDPRSLEFRDDDVSWDNWKKSPDKRRLDNDYSANSNTMAKDHFTRRSYHSQCSGETPWGRNEEESLSDTASICSTKSTQKYKNLSRKDSHSENLQNHSPLVGKPASHLPLQMAGLSMTNSSMSPTVERERLLKTRGAVANTFSLNRNDHAIRAPHRYPSEDSNENSALVSKSDVRTCNEIKRRVVEAGEVIVCNIHEDYGSAYMLHLFEQYEPIAISYIREVPKCGVRYCHVYFKSQEDSLEAEKNFDQLMLSGKKLIVLRVSTLMRGGRL
ncbi:hypothetical protein QAD02_016562 [Eretmocerus hayati]|uniref:Uncharacterized protein n=1 Tax=Eretmocerus hayati TaxID=131215 RepID=A0ACC2PG86_9HYME|nr:hypothetical protein QAD02_016562 [Eretmocerus hayati]